MLDALQETDSLRTVFAIIDIICSFIMAGCGSYMIYRYADPEEPRFHGKQWIVYLFKFSMSWVVAMLFWNASRSMKVLLYGEDIWEPSQVALNIGLTILFVTVLVFHVTTVQSSKHQARVSR